jgi:hypothetical protein
VHKVVLPRIIVFNLLQSRKSLVFTGPVKTGKYIFSNDEQNAKLLPQLSVELSFRDGKYNEVRDDAPLKVALFILYKFGKFTVVKFVQVLKTEASTVVTFGKLTDFNL